MVIGFGVVSIGTAFIHNLAGVIVTRVLLGTFEGVRVKRFCMSLNG